MQIPILTPDQKLRVFISSTQNELQEEREVVKRAVLDMSLIPVMFKGARPYPPRNMYKAWLEQSNIYIGMFWESYGWIAPGMSISGIEDEYKIAKDIAKEIKIPRLVYIKEPSNNREEKLKNLIETIQSDQDIVFQSFSTKEKLYELIKENITAVLTERFICVEKGIKSGKSINYLDAVKVLMQQRGYLDRFAIVRDILKLVSVEGKILFFGKPGMGKTFLAVAIGQKKSGIYISVKNKTPLHIFTYLTNKLRISVSQIPESFPTEDEARTHFESILQNTKEYIIIDDIDKNNNISKKLLGIDFFRNKVIFVSRSKDVLEDYAIPSYELRPFSGKEIQLYLRKKGMKLPVKKMQKLIYLSEGNPMYLYYFSTFRIDPLPKGLEEYQEALWRGLSPRQKEILGIIAVSLFAPSLKIISETLAKLRSNKDANDMNIADELNKLAPFIKEFDNAHEIFHPYFQEFIFKKISQLGLMKEYNKNLGETYANNKRIVLFTYHFLEAKDPRANETLIEAAHHAYMWGYWGIAIEFIKKEIEVARSISNKWKEGYAYYHLSLILRERGERKEAKTYTNKAVSLFKEIDDKYWTEMAKVQQYLDLISEGKGEEGIRALEKSQEIFGDADPFKKAQIMVNLSYGCIQLAQYEKAAGYAKTAYELFVELKDFHGLVASLLNLTASLGQLKKDQYVEKYANELLRIADKYGYPRLKAAGLNHLALVQRRAGKYEDAEKSLKQSVKIAQELEAKDVEILNILNLGNVFKDKRAYKKALQYYNEGLIKTKHLGLEKEEGRAYELIATIKRLQKKYREAIKYSTLAINIQKKAGDSLRLAESHDERAQSFAAVNENERAVKDYELSAEYYEAIGFYQNAVDSYRRTGDVWTVLRDDQNIIKAIENSMRCAIRKGGQADLSLILRDLKRIKKIKGISYIFLNFISRYIESNSSSNITMLIYTFVSYCKLFGSKEDCSKYIEVLKLLARNINDNKALNNMLIAGIEQADETLASEEEIYKLIEIINEQIRDLSFRKTRDGIDVWTINWRREKLITIQIQCFSDRLVEKRIACSVALLIYTYKDKLMADIEKLSRFHENNITFIIFDQQQFEEKIKKLNKDDLKPERPIIFTESNVPKNQKQPPTIIIMHNYYTNLTDWSVKPENRVIIWLMMNVYKAILVHFTHVEGRRNILARQAREFCETIFGYKEGITEIDIKRWDVPNIQDAIKKLKKER